MKLKGLTIIWTFIFAVTPFITIAQSSLKNELKAKIAEARTPDDSIKALYNLFDISPRREQIPLLEQIYNIAEARRDAATELDVVRHLANAYYGNDSVLQILHSTAVNLPASVDQHQTLMFIRINRIIANSMSATEAERQMRLREILHEYSNKEHYSVDERILLLFSLCAYLSNTTEGDLLVKYTDELEQLITSAPQTIIPIKNHFYSSAAVLFTNVKNHEKAVNAARELLNQTEILQKQYERQGRIYRKFNRQRYSMYRRMLINYPALTINEVDSIYNLALNAAKNNPDAEADLKEYKITTIAWLMAHKQFEQAAPIIKESIEKLGGKTSYYPFLLDQLNIAAEHTDNKDLQLFAARQFNKHLQDQLKFKSEERLRELQVIYDLYKIKEANKDLEHRNREMQIESHQTILTVSIVALVIVILITIITFLMYIRAKQMSVSVMHANESLEHERSVSRRHYDDLVKSRNELNKANMQKTDLINTLGHEMRTPLTAISDFTKIITDSTDDSDRPYLQHFAQIITHNVELLEAISRDILDISLLDGEEITLNRRLVNVNEICDMVMETMRQTTHSHVAMKFDPPQTPATIMTDPQRVEQILINLLKNSVRFTHSGEINLTYNVIPKQGKIQFIVTDTGCGIAPEQQKKLFTGNHGSDHHSSHGIGLYLCQMIARRLNGSVTLDPSYTNGARFVLTIPL